MKWYEKEGIGQHEIVGDFETYKLVRGDMDDEASSRAHARLLIEDSTIPEVTEWCDFMDPLIKMINESKNKSKNNYRRARYRHWRRKHINAL